MSGSHHNGKETDVLIETQGYDDHFHEHHEGDKYQFGFISKYILAWIIKLLPGNS